MEYDVSSAVPGAEASWPFDNPNAEVILRSSDNVHFRVFKGNLALASPVFKDMFTLGASVHGERPLNPYSLPISPLRNRNRVGHVAQTHLSSDNPRTRLY